MEYTYNKTTNVWPTIRDNVLDLQTPLSIATFCCESLFGKGKPLKSCVSVNSDVTQEPHKLSLI